MNESRRSQCETQAAESRGRKASPISRYRVDDCCPLWVQSLFCAGSNDGSVSPCIGFLVQGLGTVVEELDSGAWRTAMSWEANAGTDVQTEFTWLL